LVTEVAVITASISEKFVDVLVSSGFSDEAKSWGGTHVCRWVARGIKFVMR
jgi:hypothetical protein